MVSGSGRHSSAFRSFAITGFCPSSSDPPSHQTARKPGRSTTSPEHSSTTPTAIRSGTRWSETGGVRRSSPSLLTSPHRICLRRPSRGTLLIPSGPTTTRTRTQATEYAAKRPDAHHAPADAGRWDVARSTTSAANTPASVQRAAPTICRPDGPNRTRSSSIRTDASLHGNRAPAPSIGSTSTMDRPREGCPMRRERRALVQRWMAAEIQARTNATNNHGGPFPDGAPTTTAPSPGRRGTR